MARVEPHAVRLALVVLVHQVRRDEVRARVDAAEVAQRERPVVRGPRDGPPEVDDLEAAREERGRVLGGEVAVDPRDRRRGRLVDVHLRDWLARLGRAVCFARAAAAADGW